MGMGSGLCGEFMYGEQFLLFWFVRFFKVHGSCRLVGGLYGKRALTDCGGAEDLNLPIGTGSSGCQRKFADFQNLCHLHLICPLHFVVVLMKYAN